MSALGPPQQNAIACQCSDPKCRKTITVDHESQPGMCRLWAVCDHGQSLFELRDVEAAYLCWLLLVPDEPVPKGNIIQNLLLRLLSGNLNG